jgi:DNA-binding transcriptional ArsR family regulator
MNEKSERETGSAQATAHRAIRDVPSLQALAHPTRLALLEAIGLAGAMTATQASAAVGESPTACAYHLRMLARLGFIEEAGGGKGRERPWRLLPVGMTIGEDPDDPATAKASAALEKILLERFFSNIRRFDLERSRYAREVQDVTETLQSIAFSTPGEMAQLREEMIALLSRYVDRLDPARRPADGYPFEVIVFTHVLPIPGLPPGATDAQPPPPS